MLPYVYLPLLLSRTLCYERRELMKIKFKEEEIRKRLEQTMFKVARRGEPLDPEMLNPRRKRSPVEVRPKFPATNPPPTLLAFVPGS